MKVQALTTGVFLAALAFSVPAAAEMRIAVISAGELVQGSPQFKKAEEDMRAEFEKRAKELQAGAEKLADAIEKFKRDADIMSTVDKARRQKELSTQQIDQATAEQQFKEDLGTRRQELFNRVLADISEVIKAVAKDGKYDLVVQDPVYAVDSIDITATVLKRLKK